MDGLTVCNYGSGFSECLEFMKARVNVNKMIIV